MMSFALPCRMLYNPPPASHHSLKHAQNWKLSPFLRRPQGFQKPLGFLGLRFERYALESLSVGGGEDVWYTYHNPPDLTRFVIQERSVERS